METHFVDGARLLCLTFGLVLATACSESKSPVAPNSNSSAVPVITAITPEEAVAGLPELRMRITGRNFIAVGPNNLATFAVWQRDGMTTVLSTTFVSNTEVTAMVPPGILLTPGTAAVYVVNGDLMGLGDGTRYPTSNSVTFRVVEVPAGVLTGVYVATFKASASCAAALPLSARERTYTATFRPDGYIVWSGPTLQPPQGHLPISSGTITNNVLSFSIDVDRDPQSDGFHGLWDVLGDGSFLNIAGKGLGEMRAGEITGAFKGLFAFYGTLIDGRYCNATDHEFRFVKQP